jgi:acyl-CoA synthetase (AMP-forming)/AMP-acid ligase II
MNIGMILEMAASAGDRVVVTAGDRSLTATELLDLARSAAGRFRDYPVVLYPGTNHLAYPVAVFGAALAGVPFVPLNYRLSERQLADLIAHHPDALVLRDLDALLDGTPKPVAAPQDRDAIAALIYTSGTTAEPKPAVLRHSRSPRPSRPTRRSFLSPRTTSRA